VGICLLVVVSTFAYFFRAGESLLQILLPIIVELGVSLG